MGVTAGAGALAATGAGWASPTAATAAATTAKAAGRSGTMKDLKHVVITMQENRSFDHYFGTLAVPGVRGFGDKQALLFGNGQTIFFQPDSTRPDGGFLLPYRLDTTRFNAQNAGGQRMGYFTSADVPWQHALARAFTVCDHNYCALQTSTTPNRVMMWSGTNDPDGENGGPSINNSADYKYPYKWVTYPEILQQAGVSWQVYVNNDVDAGFLGDFTDNTLGRDFAVFNPANITPENSVPRQGLLARANVLTTRTSPPPLIPNTASRVNLDYVLKDFIDDCAQGLLPEVSWVVAPQAWSEHPDAAPNHGAIYVNRVITALHDNPELWDSTLLIITYDENDPGSGLFDHVPMPVPEPGTPGEAAPGIAPGLGPRVPMLLVSPWTRGGWVSSQVVSHTSLIQFLEQWTTVLGRPAICPNISAWRRSICGDLTSAIDFSSFDNSLPKLPDFDSLAAVVDQDATLPDVAGAIPAPGRQTFPVHPSQGPLRLRPVPYQQHATVAVDRSAGTVTATMTNPSSSAVSMQVFSGSVLASPFRVGPSSIATLATPNTVSSATGPKTFTADTTNGQYDFSIYGPDRFVRSFAGTVIPAGQNAGQVPIVTATLGTGDNKTLKITLSNEGQTPVQYTLTPNDYDGHKQAVTVGFGKQITIDWPTTKFGYYDVIITTSTSDGFTQRYAGRIS